MLKTLILSKWTSNNDTRQKRGEMSSSQPSFSKLQFVKCIGKILTYAFNFISCQYQKQYTINMFSANEICGGRIKKEFKISNMELSRKTQAQTQCKCF